MKNEAIAFGSNSSMKPSSLVRKLLPLDPMFTVMYLGNEGNSTLTLTLSLGQSEYLPVLHLRDLENRSLVMPRRS